MKKLSPKAWASLSLVLVALVASVFVFLNDVSAENLGQAKGDAAAGKEVFAKTCTGCHLNNGLDAGRAPVLAGKTYTQEFVTNQIRNGGTRMPKFGTDKVSDADLPNVVAYVISIGGSAPAAAPTTAAAAPAVAPTTAAVPATVPKAGLGNSVEEGFNPLWAVLPLALLAAFATLGLVGYRRARR